MFINVFRGTDAYQRSKYGINYPYIFPANKEIPDKIPTISIDNFTEIDGGPYPSSSRGPIYTFNDATTYLRGRHTFKAGVLFEYSGEDDFDQINVQPIPGTHQQPERPLRVHQRRGRRQQHRRSASRTRRMGLFTNYAEIGQRALTKWRSLSTDIFVQDSWRPTNNLTVEGGLRWAIWPPWYALTNNIATFNPAYYNTSNQAVIDPATGRIVSRPALQRHRPAGRRVPDLGERPRRLQRPGGERAVRRRAARLRADRTTTRFEPRLGRGLRGQRQDDRQGQRRRLPQPRHAERLDAARRQPAVPAAGRGQQRQSRTTPAAPAARRPCRSA